MKRRWRWPVIAAVLVAAYIIYRFSRETDTDYFDEVLDDVLHATGIQLSVGRTNGQR